MSIPTIYDIAKRAGVGIATVSRVMNGNLRVSAATRELVESAMGDLGWRPNRAARRLARRGPDRPRVAVLMPFFSTSFYFMVTRPLAAAVAAADMDLLIQDVHDRQAKQRLLDRICAERSAEGLVVCSMGLGPERLAQLAKLRIPVVVMDYPLPGPPRVCVDNLGGGRLGAQLVQERGARRPALLTGPATIYAFRQREEGFAAQVGASAPVARAPLVTREAGRQATLELLEGHPRLDALVTVNDVLALGALDALRELGRRVPDEVQVLGFDDLPLMDLAGLSTIRQPMPAFGEWAGRAITALVRDPAAKIDSLDLELIPVLRKTTR